MQAKSTESYIIHGYMSRNKWYLRVFCHTELAKKSCEQKPVIYIKCNRLKQNLCLTLNENLVACIISELSFKSDDMENVMNN